MAMSDYISREAFIADCEGRYCAPCKEQGKDSNGMKCRACWVDDMLGEVMNAPAADVEPVRYGRFECVYDDSTGETDITCSHCKNTRTVNGCFVSTNGKSCYFEDDYCPNCGAKMDLEDNHDD